MITKKNHYNPCFWMAYWNPGYYQASVQNVAPPKPREKMVYVLSMKTGKIRYDKVENAHFDKDFGLAEITREAAEAFCLKYRPEQYEAFMVKNETAVYPVMINLEQLLTLMETLPSYEVLLNVVRRQTIASPEEKVFLASFVHLQFLRSHSILKAMLEWHSALGIERFEAFVTLKWMLEDRRALSEALLPLVNCQWTLYALDEDTFPLSDSPVLLRPHSILVTLSPRLLLEIQRGLKGTENDWKVRRSIKRGKLAEFRKRVIGNTFRELIFGARELLEYWSQSREFHERMALIRSARNYNQLISVDENAEFWHVNAFGCR